MAGEYEGDNAPLLDRESIAEVIPSMRDELNIINRLSGLGARDETLNNEFYGINRLGFNSAIPVNTDGHGLTFFTRPRMNLSYDNLGMLRTLAPLLTGDQNTYQRAIRAYLDPVGHRSTDTRVEEGYRTRLVDQNSPFIPLLTNNLLSLSGWPDPSLNTYSSKEGIQKEQWSMVDDVLKFYGTFDLQATFRNIAGDPITLLFQTWLTYASAVYMGSLLPYPDSIVENEIDYQTRIYRLILDPSKRFVQKIAACGAAFPTANSLGTLFNFSKDDVFQMEGKQISIPFRCIGAEYQDPILIREFNTITMQFNPCLMDDQRNNRMVKLKPREFGFFNHYGYPLIHPRTSELEWWVFKEDYADLVTSGYDEYNPAHYDLNLNKE